MNITHGLLAGQVLQRDEKDQGRARIRGTCPADGAVEARVFADEAVWSGLDWHPVGTAREQKFEAMLSQIPVGGPYMVELRLIAAGSPVANLTVQDVYVGDVWFLAGQSNMQGVGNMEDAPEPHPLVRAFYMRDEWGLAVEPLHVLGEAVDPVHNGGFRLSLEQAEQERAQAVKGVCPGIFFGREMIARAPVPQGLVLCAHGGTSMEQWSPSLKEQGGESLYGAMLRRFHKLGQPVRGVLWYQGESDSFEEAAPLYSQRMEELVAATREDFYQPDLPWVVVQIGRVVSPTWQAQYWNSIQEQQRRLPEHISALDVVPTIDLDLDDSIHISGRDYAVLGARMARVADRLALGNGDEAGAIQLDSIKPYKRSGPSDPAQDALEISFHNVVGGLQSGSRPTGFSFVDGEGQPVPAIYKTRLQGNKVILETVIPSTTFEAFRIAYGLGLDPVCNITDSRGMAVPVLGPLPINGKGGTPFITSWRISPPVELPGGVANATLPAESNGNDWHAPYSTTAFLVMPQDVSAPQAGTFYLHATVTAAEAMDAMLALGADSPFKVWLNAAEIGHNTEATNPCLPDDYVFPVTLQKGNNQIVVAFDGRNGAGWGICARFLPTHESETIPEDAIQV